MKFGSPVGRKHCRIEIIPLIDIMFFLLASFMMVSLQMSKTQNIRVSLPKASQAKADFNPEMLNIAVDKAGGIFVEKTQRTPAELTMILTNRFRADTNLPVYISGDLETQHGAMAAVYELVRNAGVQKVAFMVTPGQPSRAPAGGVVPSEGE
jgi:biopolymer transport protein ExbD